MKNAHSQLPAFRQRARHAIPTRTYKDLIESANDIVYALDRNGRFLFYNTKGLQVLGYEQAPDFLLGKHFTEVLTADSRKVALEHFQRAIEGKQTTPFFEVEALRSDGQIVNLEVNGSNIWQRGKIVGRLGVARDITQLKRLQREIADKAQEIAVLKERARIANDLHDSVAQVLFTVNLELEWCQHQLLEGSEVYQRLAVLRQMAHRGAHELRNAIFQLSQATISREELPAAIERLAGRFEEATKIQTKVVREGTYARPSLHLEDTLYSVARELLFNVYKHAQATRVDLRTRFSGGEVVLEVQDDGIGTALEIKRRLNDDDLHFGLQRIFSLVEEYKGRIEITDQSPRGVAVIVTLPVG